MTLKLRQPASHNIYCNDCLKSTIHTKKLSGMKCSVCDKFLAWTNDGNSMVIRVTPLQAEEWLESDFGARNER